MSTDYSKMSDFEINKLVAIATGHKQLGSLGWRGLKDGEFNEVMVRGPLKIGGFDPCNNPADAWPIIINNKISIVSLDNKWIAAPVDTVIDGITGDSEVCFYASYDAVSDANPLRAAMIVFLMMQESKNAS